MTLTKEEISALLGLGRLEIKSIYYKECNPASFCKKLGEVLNMDFEAGHYFIE